MKNLHFIHHFILSILFILAISGVCIANGPVVIYDTHGSVNESDWTKVTGSPANLNPVNIVLQNDLIRITYPCKRGMPGIASENMDQKAGHLLYLKRKGEYILAQDEEYGDWSYIGGSFNDEPTGFRIVRNTKDVAEIVLEFSNHIMSAGDSSSNPCSKHLILYRGQYGYIARFVVATHSAGEREVGFGNSKSRNIVNSGHFFAYSTKTGYLWNPTDSVPGTCCHYEFLRDENQPERTDWWAVGISFTNSYYRFVGILPQGPDSPALRSASFRRGNISSLIRYNGLNTKSFSGYEAYIGAIPYDATDADRLDVNGEKATITVPERGHYLLFSEESIDKGGSKHYSNVIPDMHLRKGKNTIDITGLSLKNPVVVPLSNKLNFPAVIFKDYLKLTEKESKILNK